MCQAVIKKMLEKRYGRILNIASIAGKEGNPRLLPYSSTKAAVIGLTKSLANEVAGLGDITVNSIAPSVVQTPILDTVPQETIDYMVSRIPMGRTGKLASVAHVVRYRHTSEALSLPIFGKNTIVAEERQSIATAEAAHRAPETQRLSLRLLILATGIRYNYLGTTIRCERTTFAIISCAVLWLRFLSNNDWCTCQMPFDSRYFGESLIRCGWHSMTVWARGGGPHTSTIQQK